MTRALSSRLRLSGPRFSCTPVDQGEFDGVDQFEPSGPDDLFYADDISPQGIPNSDLEEQQRETRTSPDIANDSIITFHFENSIPTVDIKEDNEGDNNTQSVTISTEQPFTSIPAENLKPILPPISYLPSSRQLLPRNCSLSFKRLPTTDYDFQRVYGTERMSVSLQEKPTGLPMWKTLRHVETVEKDILPSISVINEEKSLEASNAETKSEARNMLFSLVGAFPQVKKCASVFFKKKRQSFIAEQEKDLQDMKRLQHPEPLNEVPTILQRRATSLKIPFKIKKPKYEDLVLPEISHKPQFLRYAPENLGDEN